MMYKKNNNELHETENKYKLISKNSDFYFDSNFETISVSQFISQDFHLTQNNIRINERFVRSNRKVIDKWVQMFNTSIAEHNIVKKDIKTEAIYDKVDRKNGNKINSTIIKNLQVDFVVGEPFQLVDSYQIRGGSNQC